MLDKINFKEQIISFIFFIKEFGNFDKFCDMKFQNFVIILDNLTSVRNKNKYLRIIKVFMHLLEIGNSLQMNRYNFSQQFLYNKIIMHHI